jgi:sulfonate transport system ATP-binding protein
MFQEPRLLPWARVADNVAVGLTGLVRGAEAREQALVMLNEVGLRDRCADWPSVLSGGQRQRVALARALVGYPQILALDEPLGALDALTRIEMQQLLERIWLKQRFTAVLVTHDVAEAVALADRVVVIDQGRIALDLAIPLPRPRRHGSIELARLEGRILDQLFGHDEKTANAGNAERISL